MTVAPAGTYTVGGVSTNCPAGTYSYQTGAKSDATCLVCPAGYYCEEAESDYLSKVCEVGYYCPEGSVDGVAF